MNSAPVCSPTGVDSGDDDVHDKLSAADSDNVDDDVAADDNVVNGGSASVNGDCENSIASSESDDGCDEVGEANPVHQLIIHCQQTGSVALDLSRRGLQSLCHRLLKLSNLQVICLSIFCLFVTLNATMNSI